MLVDAREVLDDASYSCDLCIVGTGPAGITIAERLRDCGLSIVLLESGGFEPDLATQRLFRGRVVGGPYYDLDACRYRLFGGSSNAWGGWCRPLNRADFERREWLPLSGWPIRDDDVRPHYTTAAQLLEIPDAAFDDPTCSHRLPPPFPLAGDSFENAAFWFSPPTNFGVTYRQRIVDAPNIRTILYANVLAIRLDPDGARVETLEVGTLTGRRFTIRPRAAVLATGGIENARLLLTSNRERPAGLGNENDLVGRYFMEHVNVPFGHLVMSAAHSPDYYRQRYYGEVKLRGVLVPSATAQEQHHLLGSAIALENHSYATMPATLFMPALLSIPTFSVYRSLVKGPARNLARQARRQIERASTLPVRFRTLTRTQRARIRAGEIGGSDRLYSLFYRGEQAPSYQNRVMLTDRLDALGMPLVALNWRLTGTDLASVRASSRVLADTLAQRSIGTLIPPTEDWHTGITGSFHHMGTTRMSAGERDGVVDADCCVHSVRNLYVAGSSVFVTGGYANPTFTIVALAVRLAQTLRARLTSH